MPDDLGPRGSIARAARVLDALAARPTGAAVTEVVASTGFSKSTAHRVLAALQEVDYVCQDPQSRSYRLATRMGDLSRRAALIDVAAMASRGMDRLADATEDTVFLSVPEGPVSVCAARRASSGSAQ